MSDEHIKVLRELRRNGTPPCVFAFDAEELAALDAAIAALGGVEAVAEVVQHEPYLDGTPNPMHSLRWNLDKYPSNEDDLPVGTKLYALPAPPSKEG